MEDASDRVHKKTDKAIEAAKKKHEGNAVGFTAWTNVFCSEQSHFAAVCLGPVFATYANLSGKDTAGWADQCGTKYGQQLNRHLLHNTPKPDLTAITMEMESGG